LATHRSTVALALSVATAVTLSACTGTGSGGTGSLALPHAAPATASSAVAAAGKKIRARGVTNGTARIAKTPEVRPVRHGHKGSKDYTQPSNTTTADPTVPRPNETPCTVTLFSNYQFTNFTYPTFSYTPPAACPGPWAKVVFEGDFSVNAGRQFDRTGSIWIAGTNVYFGTTAEPSANRGPSWHVERDVTGLSAILRAPSTGEVVLGNVVDSTYTGVITASGKLQFYPANAANPAAAVADDVYPLSGGPLGDNQYISSQDQPLTGTFTLPRNVEAAFLDVYLQSQIGDEFWYTCFPNDLASTIPNCGNTAFREGDVAVDGKPAGVAPVYPWIYTGGIDPYLWRPIPGVETLEFKPYRVNLTPFAALLSDGNPHTITVNVFNNGNYFAANGTLLVYLDHGSSQVTGALVSDATSLYPSPNVNESVSPNAKGVYTGTVAVTSSHPVSIDGYVNTSQGRIETKVQQRIAFSNRQVIKATTDESIFDQKINQSTTVDSVTTTSGGSAPAIVSEHKSWPLALTYDFVVNADGSATQFATVSQGKREKSRTVFGRGMTASSYLNDSVNSTDTLNFPASGGYFPSNGSSTQTYSAGDSGGYCYSKTVASKNYVVTVNSGGVCGFESSRRP
jgi:peptide N-acetyl-beta-D-glucosaminyl asparaginase amidase A